MIGIRSQDSVCKSCGELGIICFSANSLEIVLASQERSNSKEDRKTNDSRRMYSPTPPIQGYGQAGGIPGSSILTVVLGCEGCCCARAAGGWVGQWFDVLVTMAVCCRCIRSTAARKRSRQLCARCPLSRPRNPLRGSRPDRMAAALERSPEGFSWQSLVLERLGELRARHRSEIIFNACSACRVRASTPQAFVQPRRVYLPPSGAGSRQGLWRLPRSVP